MTTASTANTSLGPPVAATAEQLLEAIQQLLAAIPGGPHRPTALARRLDVSRVLASRLLSAIGKPTAVESLYHMPGPESLRAIVRGAAADGAGSALVESAEAAVEAYARLIREDFGTRKALDVAISADLPGTRARFAAASRQNVFNGMSQLLGVQGETWVSAMFMHPTQDDADAVDVGLIHGCLGVRCLRRDPQVSIRFGTQASQVGAPREFDSLDIKRFYTNAPAATRAVAHGDEIVHNLEAGDLGPRDHADMLVADYHRAALSRWAPDGPRAKRGGSVLPDLPVKQMTFDMLIHDDLFPGSDAELFTYNTTGRGPANVNDPASDANRIATPERIAMLGRGADAFANDDVPNYVPMLQAFCDHAGWNLADFRGYRARVQYPVYGWQLVMAFDAPPRP